MRTVNGVFVPQIGIGWPLCLYTGHCRTNDIFSYHINKQRLENDHTCISPLWVCHLSKSNKQTLLTDSPWLSADTPCTCSLEGCKSIIKDYHPCSSSQIRTTGTQPQDVHVVGLLFLEALEADRGKSLKPTSPAGAGLIWRAFSSVPLLLHIFVPAWSAVGIPIWFPAPLADWTTTDGHRGATDKSPLELFSNAHTTENPSMTLLDA